MKVQRLSSTHFAIDFENKFCNWFIFKLEGAKGRTVRIDLKNVALGKWSTLNPVYSYISDLADPAAFESTPPENPGTPVAAYK